MKPYKEKILSENRVIRTFRNDIEEGELTWHRDREDRLIFALNENDWLFQEDNCLPIPIKANEPIIIESGVYHRIIKGSGDLALDILKLNLDDESIVKNNISEVFLILLEKKKKKKEDDRCTRIAKKKYDVWPSAYASGSVVRCRKGDIWKNLKEEECLDIYIEDLERNFEESKKTDFSKEKESGLKGWFSRRGGEGSKGWIDCNTCRKNKETGRKKCKPCGRKEGEKRKKYPSCRPTPSDCDTKGKGSSWGKK